MCNYQEDEPPCIHHRSAFDTIPAPPPPYPSEPTMLSSMAYTLPAEPVFHLTRAGKEKLAAAGVDLSKPVTLSFEGGEVELPRPTRADLVLSARQWATAVREELKDQFGSDGSTWKRVAVVMRKVDRLDAILKELAES